MGSRVWDQGYGIKGIKGMGSRVWGQGYGIKGMGSGVWGMGCSACRVGLVPGPPEKLRDAALEGEDRMPGRASELFSGRLSDGP